MSDRYLEVRERIRGKPSTWLVTGCAGFIGSNLLQALLELEQNVVGLDNFSTGKRANLDAVRGQVTPQAWERFRFIDGDIRDPDVCQEAAKGTNHVLHQAALGSVPRSIGDPATTNGVNVSGFLNVLLAARDAGVASFTYAASSAVYGDHPVLPKREDTIGRPLSPYAVTKHVNELYAAAFARCYGFRSIGLRYFNVFGRRQDPDGAYAAVIPKWIAAMVRGDEVMIHGDGSNSRDFCFIDNVVQANLLAAQASEDARDEVYNIAVGDNTTLLQLFDALASALLQHGVDYRLAPVHLPPRPGDVMHSLADISRACEKLGYAPSHRIHEGLAMTMGWYVNRHRLDGGHR